MYLGEVCNHLLNKGPHGGNVDDLEALQIYRVVGVHVLVELSQNTQESHVGLTSTLGHNTHTHTHTIWRLLDKSREMEG